MRLVFRDVERAHAEREIDGVEILQRPRQPDEVRGEEEEYQRGADRSQAGHGTKTYLTNRNASSSLPSRGASERAPRARDAVASPRGEAPRTKPDGA